MLLVILLLADNPPLDIDAGIPEGTAFWSISSNAYLRNLLRLPSDTDKIIIRDVKRLLDGSGMMIMVPR
jgi:hypothetical protein